MSNWTTNIAPKYAGIVDATNPAIAATKLGWVRPETGEVVVVIRNMTGKNTDGANLPTLSVTLPANGTFTAGQVISFTLVSSKALTAYGKPALKITVNGVAKKAVYVSGSGTTSLVFSYTVVAGDSAGATAIAVSTAIDKKRRGCLTFVNSAHNVVVPDSIVITVPSTAGILVNA